MAALHPGVTTSRSRCITPKRASQIMAAALGHNVSRQAIYRLIDSGELRAHRLHSRGVFQVEHFSLLELIERVLNSPPN
jgi:hypothetical protein